MVEGGGSRAATRLRDWIKQRREVGGGLPFTVCTVAQALVLMAFS